VADLQAERANMTDKEYQTKIDKVNRELNDFINTHPLKDKVGVFEGANYMSKGMYRPSLMSMMHKFTDKSQGYGIVSEQAIIRVIESYTQP
jgi:hypothetical protein